MTKEIEENTNNWKDILCSWTGTINIVKMSILTNGIYRYNATKIAITFFKEIERKKKKKLKFVCNHKRPKVAKGILRKKSQARGITLSGFKLYNKADNQSSMALARQTNKKQQYRVAVPRWQRYRMGRPLSPPKIHQKMIWMLINSQRTTSEFWRRTPGTQKGSPISLKGGGTKYK